MARSEMGGIPHEVSSEEMEQVIEARKEKFIQLSAYAEQLYHERNSAERAE